MNKHDYFMIIGTIWAAPHTTPVVGLIIGVLAMLVGIAYSVRGER